MDKHQQNLEFLIAATELPAEFCERVFIAEKRSPRKSLFRLLKPKEDKESLLEQYQNSLAEEAKLAVLDPFFQHFCPNPKYKEILSDLKRTRKYKLKTETIRKIELYRVLPTKEEVDVLFKNVRASQHQVIIRILNGLRSFGLSLAPQLRAIQGLTRHDNLQVASAALRVIPHIPEGLEKSLVLYWTHLSDKDRRFATLSALQSAKGIDPEFLYRMFNPLIAEYERLSRSEGPKNELWQEFNMIRNILMKNGGQGRVILPQINVNWKKS